MADEPQESLKVDLTPEERALGMDTDITRRDFINTVAIGTGAALLSAAAPGLRKFGTHHARWRAWRPRRRLERLRRRWRLRPLERQHVGSRECGTRDSRQHVRARDRQRDGDGRDLRSRRRGRRLRRR